MNVSVAPFSRDVNKDLTPKDKDLTPGPGQRQGPDPQGQGQGPARQIIHNKLLLFH